MVLQLNNKKVCGVLKEDILELFLQAEKEYHDATKHTAEKAEKYKQERKNEQKDNFEYLRRELRSFEKSEREKFESALFEQRRKMEKEYADAKERLKACQRNRAGLISERLKREVLSSYGDHRDGKA